MNTKSIRVIKDSLTHDILMISKVLNKLISIKDLKEINSAEFSDASKVRRSLQYLSLHNLILLNDDETWIITPLGINCLYSIIENKSKRSS